jgi:hypothetical protein
VDCNIIDVIQISGVGTDERTARRVRPGAHDFQPPGPGMHLVVYVDIPGSVKVFLGAERYHSGTREQQ